MTEYIFVWFLLQAPIVGSGLERHYVNVFMQREACEEAMHNAPRIAGYKFLCVSKRVAR